MSGANRMAGKAMSGPPSSDSDATTGYKESMNAMMRDVSAYTGDIDVDFMQLMRVHPVAAIVKSGARRRIRTADTAIFSRMLYQLSYPGTPDRTIGEGAH